MHFEAALKLPLFVAAVPAGSVPVPLKVVATVAPTVTAELASPFRRIGAGRWGSLRPRPRFYSQPM
jgi:hypothetical protein